ncbi:MAG: tRNA threonylcarbamoyladenosine dehydratase [Acutalibacteraceae bacterium]|nr:tRNA threonylcarbamoyladenosine dehydratase [Acutalibacteraceae bacterium]
MSNKFSRTEMLIGSTALEKLKSSRVAVFGVGGVGGFTVEALARSGVGSIDLIDNDSISQSNINRQIIADTETIGRMKTEVMSERIKKINPDCTVNCHNFFILPENAGSFDFTVYDYVVDAIDTVSGKIAIIERCNKLNIPVISSMGTGNKLDPTLFEITDIHKTSVCPLARVMRLEMKKRGIKKLKVLYSKEQPIKPLNPAISENGKPIPGSISFVPSVAGLIIGGEVIKDLIK